MDINWFTIAQDKHSFFAIVLTCLSTFEFIVKNINSSAGL